ncbi:thialysine N-epsilon-acetyltransferase-like [Culicoides brevitarsis]|uniref:thialysine N-epsilon-acetyltransferase-like n=1 Tax=Culicoides brevitarsis TaxID=469753 RepID=UPI00307B4E73
MSDPKITIRKTEKDDLQHVFSMIQELIAYQNATPTSLTLDDLIRDGGFTGAHPLYFSFFAECDGKPVGYTIAFYAYSTWEGRSLLLEDIYVKPEARNHGVGRKLMQATVQYGIEQGCSRLDLHVLKSNETARKFYGGIGATNLTETEGWMYYNFGKSEMEKIVKGE